MLKLISAFLISMLLPMISFATPYPNGPITIYINVAPGGTLDRTARLMADILKSKLSTQVVVANLPGGGGVIASTTVKNSKPNGYTLYLMSPAHLVSTFVNDTSYHPYNDFSFIGPLVTSPMVILSTDQSIKNFNQISNTIGNEELSYVASTVGSGPHLALLSIEMKLNKKFLFIPHRGAGTSITDLISNRVNFGVYVLPSAMGIIGSNSTVKPIAVTSLERHPLLPDTPTLNELGIKNFSIDTYYGLIAPKGVPDHIITMINTALNEAFSELSVVKLFNELGLTITPMSPEKFRNYIISRTSELDEVTSYYKKRIK